MLKNSVLFISFLAATPVLAHPGHSHVATPHLAMIAVAAGVCLAIIAALSAKRYRQKKQISAH